MTYTLKGGKPKEEWRIEVESDCFDVEDGLVVSLAVDNFEDGDRQGDGGLAWLTPKEARDVALFLIQVADHVDHRLGVDASEER